MEFNRKIVALEGRLRRCRNVVTIGVRPNFCDYDPAEREMLRAAETIYYPTAFYADLFNAAGKNTFPSYHTYKCVQDKIKQTALFELLGIPHPRTRVFYGKRQKAKIGDFFQFPFIAKIPRGSARGKGVYLVRNGVDLEAYCGCTGIAYIQDYLPIDRDMRIVVIGKRIVHAYWRIAAEGEFRTNVSAGGRVILDPVPEGALHLALQTARACGWDDVGIDICRHDGSFVVLEANMKYGLEGFRKAGIDYVRLLETMIEQHEI